MNDLAGFSEWTLALLPRLFLYPGGLWLLAVVLGMRFAVRGRRGIGRNALLSDFSRADLGALATGWTAVALLPLQGAALLTFPTDRLALAGLLAISLAFDSYREYELRITNYELRIELGILAAMIVPLAGQRNLLMTHSGLAGWISLLAVLVGVAALAPQAENNLSLAVRLTGWLGLAAAPLWALPRLDDPLRLLAAYSFLVVGTALVGRIAGTWIKAEWSMVVVWSLAALSLLTALLFPA